LGGAPQQIQHFTAKSPSFPLSRFGIVSRSSIRLALTVPL